MDPQKKHRLAMVSKKITGGFFFDHFCYLCFVFVMLFRQFIAALWSPAGKGPLGPLVCDVLLCFVPFPCGVLVQMWYLNCINF